VTGIIIYNREAELIYCANDFMEHMNMEHMDKNMISDSTIHIEDDGLCTDGTYVDGFTCQARSPCPLLKITAQNNFTEHLQHSLLQKLERFLSEKCGVLIQLYLSSNFSISPLSTSPFAITPLTEGP